MVQVDIPTCWLPPRHRPSWHSTYHSQLELSPIRTDDCPLYSYIWRNSVHEHFPGVQLNPHDRTTLSILSIRSEGRGTGKADTVIGMWKENAVVAKIFDHKGTYSGVRTSDPGDFECAREVEAYHRIKKWNEQDKYDRKSQHFVPFLGLFETGITSESLGTRYVAVIIMGYCKGLCFRDWPLLSALSLEGRKQLMEQIMQAVCQLFKLGIFHRSIRPRNILLDLDATCVKIIDFGCWSRCESGDRNRFGDLVFQVYPNLHELTEDIGFREVWEMCEKIFDGEVETEAPS